MAENTSVCFSAGFGFAQTQRQGQKQAGIKQKACNKQKQNFPDFTLRLKAGETGELNRIDLTPIEAKTRTLIQKKDGKTMRHRWNKLKQTDQTHW